MILPIRTYGDDVLRRKAKRVEVFDDELRRLADNMAETMYRAPGIGLAAPQVGAGIRLIVVDVSHDEVRDNLLGIRLSLPLPLFDRNHAGIQDARARRHITEGRLTAAARDVEREVETAYTSYLNAEKAMSLYKTAIIPQLEENLALTQEAYRLGEVGILAVIQEQKKFFEVSDGYLTALHDRQTALAELEAAVASAINGGAQ